MAEVGGLGFHGPATPLLSPVRSLPRYVPIIQHPYRRSAQLEIKHVAIPTFAIIRGAGANYGPIARNGVDLRDRLLLLPDANVIGVSVSTDPHLERYWASATELNIPAKVAPLELWGATAPNFSFFDGAPRTHIVYNRARIVRAAENLSRAGVPSVLHLNASTQADWKFWVSLLRDNPSIRYVAKEFQTGARHDQARANWMMDGLEFVQARVSQELHPLIVGGTQYAPRIGRSFPHATFLDSRPFMGAMKRRCFEPDGPRPRWVSNPTDNDESLDELLHHNIHAYTTYVESIAGSKTDSELSVLKEDEDEILVDIE